MYAFHNRQSRLLCTSNQEAGVLFQIQFWPLILSCCCCCRGINLVGAAIIGVWEGEQGEGAPFVHTSTNKSVRRVCFSTGGFFLSIFGRYLNFMDFKFPSKRCQETYFGSPQVSDRTTISLIELFPWTLMGTTTKNYICIFVHVQ